MPEEPEQVLVEQGIAVLDRIEELIPTNRSERSRPETSATAGIENMTISDVISVAQTKIGMRASVIPALAA